MNGPTKITSDGAAVVDTEYFWQPIETAPRGVKIQLLSKYGVAVYGQYTQEDQDDNWYIMWAPLPKRPKRPIEK